MTRRVVERQADLITDVYSYPSGGGNAIPKTLWRAARLSVAALSGYVSTIYIICSRSNVGFLRDVVPLLLSRFGVRIVVHVHGSDFPALFERPFIGILAHWLYRKCEVIIPSAHLVPRLESHAFRRLVLCENFAEIPQAVKVADTMVLDNSDFMILWNSNVIASKGIAELVQGIRLLRKEGTSIRLVLLGKAIGDSEMSTAAMQRYLEKLRQESWIDVKGIVPPEEVPRLIAESDVIALPSTYSSECQPLAVIQGMLAGRRLLVSDTPAMRATVGNYPATFVERHPTSIAQALRPLARGRKRPAEFEAASLARDRFSCERFDRCIRHAISANEPT